MDAKQQFVFTVNKKSCTFILTTGAMSYQEKKLLFVPIAELTVLSRIKSTVCMNSTTKCLMKCTNIGLNEVNPIESNMERRR